MSNYSVILNRPAVLVDESGSLVRMALGAVTSSYALTASYVEGVLTSNTGSFTGSFVGDGSGLTGIVATGVGVEVSDDGQFRGIAERLSFNQHITASVSNGTASIAVVLPSGLVSASSQATAWTVATSSVSLNSDLLGGQDSSTYASTGSNSFLGNQTISGSVNITGSIYGPTHIDISTTTTSPSAVGRLVWNDGDGTLDLGLKGGQSVLQLGQELVARVYNPESTTLVDGEVVYISGSQGNRISVRRASATAEQGSANTIGVVTEPILPGQEGFITIYGVVRGLNTLGLTPGAVLWLGTTPGTYTQVRPEAPNHGVSIGYVERVHASVGAIYVRVQNGYELDELHDVNISPSASHGDLIFKSGSVWVNGKHLSGSYGVTGSITVLGTISASLTLPSGLISSSAQINTGSFSGSLIGTSSFALQALTASYVSGVTSTWDTLSNKPDGLVSSSNQINTGSFTGSLIGTLVGTSSWSVSSSFSSTALTVETASYAPSSSYAETASFFTGFIEFTDGLTVTGSVLATDGFTGSLNGTSTNAVSSSYALTASYALNGVGAGVSSSYALTASYAFTVSVAQYAATASYFSGSALFENGLIITGSTISTDGFTGSLAGTSSVSLQNIITASLAATTITFTKGDGTTFDVIIAQSGSVESASYADTATSASYTETASISSVATQLQATTLVTPPVVVSPSYVTITSGAQHLTDGTYIVSCVADTPQLSSFRLSGVLSWMGSVGPLTIQDEVPVHRSGYTTASVFLRTRANSGSLPELQLGSDLTLSSSVFTFKFTPIL